MGTQLMIYRATTFVLAFLTMSMVAWIVENNMKDDEQSCPALDVDQVRYKGRVAKKGEGCEYDGPAPRCVNAQLPGDNGENELVCKERECIEKLKKGDDCTITVGIPPNEERKGDNNLCVSDLCVESRNGVFECAKEHFLSVGHKCLNNDQCEKGLYCTNPPTQNVEQSKTISITLSRSESMKPQQQDRYCNPRTAKLQPCTHVDPLGLKPSKYGSLECEKGSYCTTRGPRQFCLEDDADSPGSPCQWESSTESRPICNRGKLYCSNSGSCQKLIKENDVCTFNVRETFSQNCEMCEYGYGCSPDLPPSEWNGLTTTGICKKVRDSQPGTREYIEGFCRADLYLDSVDYLCKRPGRLLQGCTTDSDCHKDPIDVTMLSCHCGKAHALAAPGICKRTPLSHPNIKIDFIDGCSKEFGKIVTFYEQFYKDVSPHDEDKYDYKEDQVLRKGYCCMNRKLHKSSVQYYLTGLFLVDLKLASYNCNTDLRWLAVVVSVLGASIVIGVCVVISSCFKPENDERLSSDETLESDQGSDAVANLINKTSLPPGKITSLDNVPPASSRLRYASPVLVAASPASKP